MSRTTKILFLCSSLVAAACTTAVDDGGSSLGPEGGKEDLGNSQYCDENPNDPLCGTYGLQDLDSLTRGVPSNDSLPIEEKRRDERIPSAYYDLLAYQTPVKSQGSRGVCSIFATVAYVEHLYMMSETFEAGEFPLPDFSEQFLQWSTKVELGKFTSTGGSNSRVNLSAFARFGVPWETAWPYESSVIVPEDVDCEGEEKDVLCYTNGNPSEEALEARRFFIDRGGRWVNSDPENIKINMKRSDVAVQAGGAFFYQSWNHGLSDLPTNDEYSAAGYVLTPNAKDEELSGAEDKRAGHSFLLVGWNDELEVQRVNSEGKKVFCEKEYTDENGKCPVATGSYYDEELEAFWIAEDDPELPEDAVPVMDRGFFLFKNSWGADRFGVENPLGEEYAGYGWISYAYTKAHLNVYIADVPEYVEPFEVE